MGERDSDPGVLLAGRSRLKNNRRVATRHDHTAGSLLGFVLLGCVRLGIRCVHAT